jgi:hypothetical protein
MKRKYFSNSLNLNLNGLFKLIKYKYDMKTVNYIKWISLITLSLMISVTFSCKNAAKKATEKMIEKSIQKSSGEDVDVDLDNQNVVIETEEGRVEVNASGKSWPKEIPSDVPEFKYGKISGVTTTKTDENLIWTIVFSEISKDAIDKYNKELKSKGFETQTVTMSGLGGTISGEKDDMKVAVMMSEGNASVSIQVGI